MKVPAVLHGADAEVKKRCSAVIRKIAEGATLMEAVSATASIDTSSESGLLLLGRPGRPIASQQHFVFYVLPAKLAEAIVDKRIVDAREPSLFSEILATAWSTLGTLTMLGGASWTKHDPERAWVLLEAYVRHWDAFVAEGPRYSSDLVPGGKHIWQVPSFLGPVLSYCGVPDDVLRERLRSEGLPPLLRYIRPRGRP